MPTLFRLIRYFDPASEGSPPERRARINTLRFPVPTDVDSLRFPLLDVDSPDHQFEFDFDDLSFALSVPYPIEDAPSSFSSEVFPPFRGGYWTASSDGEHGEASRHGEELIGSETSNEELSDSGDFHQNVYNEPSKRSPATESQTPDILDGFPEDVLVELCCRLPKKYQLRCEAVSKNWQNKWQILTKKAASLTTGRALNSGFVEIIRNDSTGDTLFKFYRLNNIGRLLDLDSLKIPRPTKIGSSNGYLFYDWISLLRRSRKRRPKRKPKPSSTP